MTRQSEYKKKFNPETGKFVREHIYGEGVITDTLKSIGKKVFGKTVKSAAKKAMTTTATKTGEYVGKKAGDKIVNFLSKEKKPKKSTPKVSYKRVNTYPKNNQHEINTKVNAILSGGKII